MPGWRLPRLMRSPMVRHLGIPHLKSAGSVPIVGYSIFFLGSHQFDGYLVVGSIQRFVLILVLTMSISHMGWVNSTQDQFRSFPRRYLGRPAAACGGNR